MFLVDLHCRLAIATLFFAIVLGLWGGVSFLLRRGVSGSYFGALVIGEILVLVEALLGILLVITGHWPADVLHFLYGVLIALAWPGVYTYTQAQASRREMGVYAIVSLLIFGLALRGMVTGAGSFENLTCLPH